MHILLNAFTGSSIRRIASAEAPSSLCPVRICWQIATYSVPSFRSLQRLFLLRRVVLPPSKVCPGNTNLQEKHFCVFIADSPLLHLEDSSATVPVTAFVSFAKVLLDNIKTQALHKHLISGLDHHLWVSTKLVLKLRHKIVMSRCQRQLGTVLKPSRT